jgi:hypothetical protein
MSVNLIHGASRKAALKKLTDRYKLSDYMGELFINEIHLVWYKTPIEQQEVVKHLGLFDRKKAVVTAPECSDSN